MTIFRKTSSFPIYRSDAHARLLLAMGFDEEDFRGNILREGADVSHLTDEQIKQMWDEGLARIEANAHSKDVGDGAS